VAVLGLVKRAKIDPSLSTPAEEWPNPSAKQICLQLLQAKARHGSTAESELLAIGGAPRLGQKVSRLSKHLEEEAV